jgi:hypothetical protein
MISRRALFEMGAGTLFSGVAAASGTSNPAVGKARRCILVYLLGGPSHLDMWDLKPQAPREIRGPFKPIETRVPGIYFSEHLPELSQRSQRIAVLRSMTYGNNDHPFMTYYTLTGRVSPIPLGANTVLDPQRSDDPHMGSVMAKFLHRDDRVPGYVAIPEVRVRMSQMPVAGGGRAGFLGPRYDPLAINSDPSVAVPLLDLPEGVSSQRFDSRRSLLALIEGRPSRDTRYKQYQYQRDTASRLTRSKAGSLVDLSDEPPELHSRYGSHRFGKSLLLARRLVERGVSFVGVHFNYMSQCDGWDTHKDNFRCLKEELLPMLDQGLSALLDDLALRGLLDETLVVTMGEFGRTPVINSNAGRDHWGLCASALFAGGGVRGGTVVGQSDSQGAVPVSDPVTPPDIVASIYHALGVSPTKMMYDQFDRPLTLSTGKVVNSLFL